MDQQLKYSIKKLNDNIYYVGKITGIEKIKEHNQQHKNITWKLQNRRKNHGRCLNRQPENKHYMKIVTTYRLHSQPPHDPSTPTLSKVNI